MQVLDLQPRVGKASDFFADNSNHRVSKCWMKTSDQGKSSSTKGSVSGQKACGAPGDLKLSSGYFSVLGALSEEPESLPTSGHLTSPNFPANYPNKLHERKTIKVAKGNVINIHFTDLDLERPYDYVDIIDGDGTFLGHFGPRHNLDEGVDGEGSGDGNSEGGERMITSFTEWVHVLFHTDDSESRSGWRLEWSK